MNPELSSFAREVPVSRHLPYARHVNSRTIETQDGRQMQFIRLRGLLFETEDGDELAYRAILRDAMVRSLGSSRYALYHHIVRRQVDVGLSTEFPDAFSRELDQRWRGRLASRQLYQNELTLTLVRRPMKGRLGTLDRLVGRVASKAERQATKAAELRQLHAASEALISALTAYAPRYLEVYESGGDYCSEALEFLGELLNGNDQPVLLPYQNIADGLARRRISFGDQAIEFAAAGDAPRQFAAMVSIKDYAGQTSPGMFDDLLRLPIAMTVSQSFTLVERQAALEKMNLALRRMRSAEDEALSLRDELTLAKDEVAAGRAGYGEHHLSIMVRGASLDELDAGVAEVVAVLADLGIVAVREDVALEPTFWAQFPGNFAYIARKGLISTRNFAGFASLHNFASGKARGNHWGEAVSLLETTAAGPYFLNLHQADLGNFTVIGPSGSGKTVILNFLLAQARRFDPRIIFFDKDRGAEIFLRAIGGHYDRLVPGEPSGLNPLRLPDTPANRQFLADWLTLLAGSAGASELDQIHDAIDANYAAPARHRRLRHLAELLRGGEKAHAADLYSRLKPWWGDGPHAWLFDNADDQTDLEARVVGFDMTLLLDDPILRTPAMYYLFHRVEERLDGSPAIIVVDEGWKALDDPIFVARIRDWEKTIRKKNGLVGFATQSPEDALQSKISSAIIEQAATQIFTVNPKAREADYVGGFKLTPHEYALLKSLPQEAHCFLVRQGQESAIVRLDLSGERDLLAILSGREATVRRLDELRRTHGDRPADWLPQLKASAA
ncbi:VirB4 family type IV secretion/conjugal transfer ATPase [Sphingomonas sp. ASV193]|uniref:VirB4 family type IV secretion/conjugal transfer ATPase n=1 Tax=Sphingomonas sp. ASV193 TaxID=3144405 RepID=UPI0032E8D2A4